MANATNNTLPARRRCLLEKMVIRRLLFVTEDYLRRLNVFCVHLAAQDRPGALPTHPDKFADARVVLAGGVGRRKERISTGSHWRALVRVKIPKVALGQVHLIRLTSHLPDQGARRR